MGGSFLYWRLLELLWATLGSLLAAPGALSAALGSLWGLVWDALEASWIDLGGS